MAWLLRDDEVLASVEVVTDRVGRLRGVSGRDRIDGLVLLRPARAAHTFGAPGPTDVVFCDAHLAVTRVVRNLRPFRLLLPRWGARCVIQGEAGFAEWYGIKAGDQLGLEGVSGALVLVATPIGNLGDLSPRAVETLAGADVILCEDTRRTRQLLTHAGVRGKRLVAMDAHREAQTSGRVLGWIREGLTVALVTDAGMPAVSDPGARLVAAVVAAEEEVRVVPGPSAALAALAASGLPTDRFAFEGFLPRKGADRAARLRTLAGSVVTTVIFESPLRVGATLADLVGACGGSRRVAVARELTKLHEEVWRGPLSAAAELAAAAAPRGEHVIVLAGCDPSTVEPDDDQLQAAVQAHLDEGSTARDVARAVTEEMGVPHRRAYAVALRLRSG